MGRKQLDFSAIKKDYIYNARANPTPPDLIELCKTHGVEYELVYQYAVTENWDARHRLAHARYLETQKEASPIIADNADNALVLEGVKHILGSIVATAYADYQKTREYFSMMMDLGEVRPSDAIQFMSFTVKTATSLAAIVQEDLAPNSDDAMRLAVEKLVESLKTSKISTAAHLLADNIDPEKQIAMHKALEKFNDIS